VTADGDAPTRDRVARTILENGPSTAADLARLIDLTPAAVRRHLDHLADEGVVESRDQKVYGTRGRGRPAKVFALTESGRDSFDQQYDDLAVQAMRFLALRLGEEPHGLNGQVVVLLVEAVAPRLGQREHLGRTAATAGAVDLLVARLHDSLGGEVVEVPAYGGGGEVEPLGERRGGGGSVDEDRPHDALTRRLVVPGNGHLVDFHNTSVPLLFSPLQGRRPLPARVRGGGVSRDTHPRSLH